MICPNQVQLGEYAASMEGRGEVLNVRGRVVVRNGGFIQASIVTTCRQSPGVFLGTMWRGDAQLLEEGRMMPNSNMCSNY